MHFTANRKDLLQAIKVIAPVAAAERAGGQGNLSAIRIEAVEGQLLLEATDQLRYVSRSLPIDPEAIKEPGVALVPAKRLSQIIGDFGGETVELKTSKSSIKIIAGSSDVDLTLMADENYPSEPELKEEGAVTATVNAATLAVGLEKCFCFATADDKRYSISGVNLRFEKGTFAVAATDTHRLSVYTAEAKISGETNCLIPRESLSDITTMADVDHGDFVLTVTANILRVKSSSGTYTTSLIEGVFPRYEEIMPTDTQSQYTVPAAELSAAIKTASRVAQENKIVICFDPKGVVVTVPQSETGKAQLPVAGSKCDRGEGLTITLNQKFVSDALKHVVQELAVIEANTGADPILITEGSWKHIIMPIQEV